MAGPQNVLRVTTDQLTWPGWAWALASAARMSSCWEGPLGAVREDERPSWFTAVPFTMAKGPPAWTPAG